MFILVCWTDHSNCGSGLGHLPTHSEEGCLVGLIRAVTFEGAAPQDKIRLPPPSSGEGRGCLLGRCQPAISEADSRQEPGVALFIWKDIPGVAKQAGTEEEGSHLGATGMSGSLHPHLQLTPTGDHVYNKPPGGSQQRAESWGVHAPEASPF